MINRLSTSGVLALAGFASIAVACAGSPDATAAPSVSTTQSAELTASSPTLAPSVLATSAASPSATPAAIVGVWHRLLTCDELTEAFEQADLLETHSDWLGDPCAGSRTPEEHSHFFTDTGEFGSRDENHQQVDNGDYTVVDADTLAFPSHSSEFGYDSDILVDYRVTGDAVSFTIQYPAECTDSCLNAFAWATSAFGTNPWKAGDVP